MESLRSGLSFLFVPGDRPDRFEKAVAAGADVVILDLEDAVDASAKERARRDTAAWLGRAGSVCVRVNAAGTAEHTRDLDALRGSPGLAGVVLPKADLASTSTAATNCGVPVIALVESAVGVAEAGAVAAAPGVVRLAFGHLDYAVDIGAQPSHTAMLQARSTLVHASRLAGLPGPIDGVTTALDDAGTLLDDVRHAQEVGMAGKILIHPRQVQPAHEAFRPDPESVQWANRVIAAVDGGSAVSIDGHMADAPVIARAQEILARAR